MATAHALLSASGSHRWLNCTPSAVAETEFPDQESDFAKEGTLAHAIGAKKLKEHLGLPTDDEDREIAELRDQFHTGEMEEYTDAYAEFVLGRYGEAQTGTPDAVIAIERRLDFSDIVPDGFGTGDAVIIADGLMEIIDLKYGKGVKVSAVENPQMMLYAIGALNHYLTYYGIDRVRMTIYQPRISNYSAWECTAEDLLRWGEDIEPLARLAHKGRGVRNPGDWCRFCRAASTCTRLAEKNLSMLDLGDTDSLAPDVVAKAVLPNLPILQAWMDRVKERALADALAGTEFPGWKVVRGRSVRKITDQEAATTALSEAGYGEAEIFRPRELRTIGDLEKLCGKKRFAEIVGDALTKPEGKPTLVEETDRRDAIKPGDDFAGMV